MIRVVPIDEFKLNPEDEQTHPYHWVDDNGLTEALIDSGDGTLLIYNAGSGSQENISEAEKISKRSQYRWRFYCSSKGLMTISTNEPHIVEQCGPQILEAMKKVGFSVNRIGKEVLKKGGLCHIRRKVLVPW